MRRYISAGLTTALLTLGLIAGCGRPHFPPRPNLLLITVDTLRADHLGAWGYPRDTSPFLDRLAADGVRFSDAWVQWPKTGPSMASIFTSTYGRDNGVVRRVGTPVPGAFRMLAEELSGLGYATGAVVANGALGSEFNFHQGFDRYVESWKDAPRRGADPTEARRVTDLAIQLAGELGDDRPYFLWVHYLDPHAPYTPPGRFRDRFQGDAWFDPGPQVRIRERGGHDRLGGIARDQSLDGISELAFYVARYDAEIAYTDSQIQRLWEGLEEQGRLRRTLTVLTSDHGESLGEHDYYFDHGRFAFETCLNVPLILHFPGVLDAGVIQAPVELLDLAPTLLEAAGRELPDGAWMQGKSLTRLIWPLESADAAADEYIFAEAGYALDDVWQKAVRRGRYKLIMAPWTHDQRYISGERGDRYTLYDLERDPGELHDIKRRHKQIGKDLHDALAAWLNRPPFPVRLEDGVDATGEMAPETREQLEALGYL